MQPDEIRKLQQFQRYAAGWGELARDLALAIPAQVNGSDATGWVLVVLGRDGIPAQIEVREGWRHRLEPDRLASAVLEANADAVQRAMQTWSNTVDDGGWRRRRADLKEHTDAQDVTEGMPDAPFGHARDSNDVAEEVLQRLKDAQTSQAASPAAVQGHDDGGSVRVEIASGGLTGCGIEPDWAGRHDGATISAALSTALRRAVARYPAPPSVGEQPDTLIGDALATLRALTASPLIHGGN